MSDTTKPSFSGPELCKLEAHEVVGLLRKKEIAPKDLLDASFERIEATSAITNATPVTCPERAYAHAEKIEGAPQEWLSGLPIGIKDLTTVSGVRTTFGTVGLKDNIPKESDLLVQRLEARGGIVVGKTNTPEFGAGANTFNDVHGATLNPWNTQLNAGGSSGGAAAALATGETWLSHGSDHGGSLRTPAAFCGVVGLRPSPGRVLSSPGENGYMIEGAQGPMARSVRDCGLFLDAMAGFDPRSPISYPSEPGEFQKSASLPAEKLHIAFTPDLNGFSPVDPEVESHLRGVMDMLEGIGCKVEDHCPSLDGLDHTYRTLRGMLWASLAQSIPNDVRKHFKDTLEENMAAAESMRMVDVASAYRKRTQIFAQMTKLFETFDVLALPSVGCMPHAQSEEWVREINGHVFEDYLGWLRFAYLSTVTGLPAISVPVGIGPRGLPVGLQLIGKPRGEAALLSAARTVELTVGGPLGPIDPVTC